MVNLQRAGWRLSVLSLLLLLGCTSGSGLVMPPGQGPASGPPPLPASDTGLAEHVPHQVIIGLLPGMQVQTVVAVVNGKVLKEFSDLHAVVVELPQDASIVESIRKVQAISGIKYAEPNYIYRIFRIPNDPFFATKQWGPQKINAPSAWDVTIGTATSVVAVLDQGLSTGHPKFSGKVLTGTNCTGEAGFEDAPIGHGTHVAGIAAAIGDTGAGIAGIAWAASILPIKVCDRSGACITDDVACGIVAARSFATSNPVMRVVANLSLGGLGYSQLQKDAVDSALANNVVVIAAAGNDGTARVIFPAGYSGVIAVGAITPTNDRAPFSNYGSHLSVVAPGADIYSTLPGASYGYFSGTSQATPHVTGVAALIRGLRPSLSPGQVRTQIEQTATRLGGSGFNPQFGWGLVNAAAAVGAPVTSNFGTIQVTVLDGVTPAPAADVIVWVGTASCLNLSTVVQTAQTNSPGGIALFNAIPAGSYCATASKIVPPPKRATTTNPFSVTAGTTQLVVLTLAPGP